MDISKIISEVQHGSWCFLIKKSSEVVSWRSPSEKNSPDSTETCPHAESLRLERVYPLALPFKAGYLSLFCTTPLHRPAPSAMLSSGSDLQGRGFPDISPPLREPAHPRCHLSWFLSLNSQLWQLNQRHYWSNWNCLLVLQHFDFCLSKGPVMYQFIQFSASLLLVMHHVSSARLQALRQN